MNTLVLAAYGDDVYIREAIYCILSAHAFQKQAEGVIRYVVYTDKPREFARLDVETIRVTGDMLRRWHGKWKYVHRAKTFIILDALERFKGNVVYVDTDTYFRKAPQRLFRRVRPGHAIMHVKEYRLSEIDNIWLKRLQVFLSRLHNPKLSKHMLSLRLDEAMWNAGVIGLHCDDKDILKDIIWLTDLLLSESCTSGLKTAEQFATTYFLTRSTKLRPSIDVVFHYWPNDLKAGFRSRLCSLLEATQSPDLQLWGRRARRGKPRGTVVRRLKMHARAGMRALGLRVPGPRTSA